jgi:small subunit ribosomal protein S1
MDLMSNNFINKDKDSSIEEDSVMEAKGEEIEDEESFEELFKQSEEKKKIKEGQIVKGTIVSINNDEVLIDIGYKSEGRIPANQFEKVKGQINHNIGDEIDVIIEKKENDSGQIILSKEKADKIKLWNSIANTFEKGGVVGGKITSKIKGGFSVDVGVKAFLPASQVDNKPVKDFDKFIGQKYSFKVLEFNKAKGNIVLSRKALLDTEAKKVKEKLLESIHEGMELEGVIKNLTDYGVFVDLGNIDGLLHITDISWGRVSHPTDVFKVGDEINVVVLKYDKEEQRISLGHKQLTEDPWKKADERYPINSRVKGKVVTILDYGAFIEIENGIEGLIHISEMSWTRKIKHPSKILSIGDEVEVVVLSLNAENRRLSLGLKQVEENPWDKMVEKYPIGTVVEKPIKNITDFGLFVEFEDGIDGLIHISDVSWGKKIKNLKDIYNKGDLVKAKIIELNPSEDKCSLSIKDLTENPWAAVEKKYRKGTIVTGIIKSITDFGTFVELEKEIEGLIHISEVKSAKEANASDQPKVGDEIKAVVTFCSAAAKKISLSIKDLEERLQRDEIDKYLKNQEEVTSKLMDFVTHNSKDNKEEKGTKESAEETAEESVEESAEENVEENVEESAEENVEESAEENVEENVEESK